MAKTKKKKLQETVKTVQSAQESTQLAKTVLEHYNDSWDYVVSNQLTGWDEKEALFYGINKDKLSNNTKSKIFDPRLSTIGIERAARVNAQNPSGKPLAMSQNDKGKNLLMNMLLEKYVLPNADSQFDYLIKNRLWDLYSYIYGVCFKLVDQRVSDEYSGPDSWLLNIRDCRPQPGKFSIESSDYFGVSTWVTPEYLKSRNKKYWNNIDKLLLEAKTSTPRGENDSNRRSYYERRMQPSTYTEPDKKLREIELYTEYRKDRWITIAPDHPDCGVIRDVRKEGYCLPIVAKYCFPTMESIYGLGEFERGKTLQLGVNSLINMYMDSVKKTIEPPLLVMYNDVIASSLVDGPSAKWFVKNQNAIQPLNLNPQGIQTFQSTYNFLIAAIMNQAGTTDTTVSATTDISQGKTPKALQLQAARENSRDSWDRFMMETAIEQEMKLYVNLISKNMNKDIPLRLFPTEIEQIAKIYPDITQALEGQDYDRAEIKLPAKELADIDFDYQIVSGSTYKADQEQELTNTQNLLDFTIKNYDVLQQSFAQKNKMIDLAELYQRTLTATGTSDAEKIVVDIPPELLAAQAAAMPQMPQQMPPGMPQDMGGGQMPPMPQMPQQMPNMEQNMPPQEMNQMPQGGRFHDPSFEELASQLLNPNL